MSNELINPTDGENQAVRAFLRVYSGTPGLTFGLMKRNLKMSGYPHWPEWANEVADSQHLNKLGAQNWLRHLFSLEAAPVAAPQSLDAQRPTVDEVKRLVRAFESAILSDDARPLEQNTVSAAKAELHAAIEALAAPVAAQPTALEELRKQKDGAYFERNQVVAALAKCFPSGVAKTAIEGWSEDWHGCVYIDLPTGQVSWHFHDSQAYLFKDLPPYAGKWDGHDTPEKYRRVNALAAQPQQAKPLSDAQPRLRVRLQSFPESNGKRNWTALLCRDDENFDGLVGNCGGIQIARGELWNRVAYHAEEARFLIGERDTEPHILDYGDDIETPEQWAGEVRNGIKEHG